MLGNIAFAVRAVLTRKEQVVVTLDKDDSLLGTDTLQRIHDAHFKVGSHNVMCCLAGLHKGV